MAKVIETRKIFCPYCRMDNELQVWSCGCRTFSDYPLHVHIHCKGVQEKYFSKMEQHCGKEGLPGEH